VTAPTRVRACLLAASASAHVARAQSRDPDAETRYQRFWDFPTLIRGGAVRRGVRAELLRDPSPAGRHQALSPAWLFSGD